jgi:DNA-binding SARP family transcriptional activator
MDKGSPPASEHAGPALRVLGGLTLRTGGREVSFGRSIRARRLLAALVINRGELVTADRLAQVTWGEALPADPRAATHNLISRLRTLIGDDSGIEVMTRVPGYVLAAQPGAVDATVFEDQVRAARQEADPQRSLAQLDAALALWRGPAYADFADEEFARVEARRLTLLGQAAQEDRIDRMLALGLNDDAVLLLERAVAADPLRAAPDAADDGAVPVGQRRRYPRVRSRVPADHAEGWA